VTRVRINKGHATTIGRTTRARVNRVSGRGHSVPHSSGLVAPPGFAWVIHNGVLVLHNGQPVYTAVP
jgi:hypothetical protein